MDDHREGEGRPVYGARGRIGMVIPANNGVIEPEFARLMPDGVAAFATKVPARGDLTAEAVRRMEARVDEAAEMIVSTGIDALLVCDMVTSFVMEPDWNEAAVARFEALHGVPTATAWSAMEAALKAAGARRLALLTPYPASLHALAGPFFAARGFTLASDATLDIVAMSEVPTVTAERLTAAVAALDTAGADAVVALATDLPSFSALAAIEARTGLPFLTSNQCLLWWALSRIGVPVPAALGRIAGLAPA